MLKKTIILVLATLALTFLLLSIPSTVAYSRVETEVVAPVKVPDTPILEVKKLEVPKTETPDSLRVKAIAVKEAIAQLEGKGKDCTHTPGLSGEKGCYQYLYGTWAAYSKEIYGYVADQTAENTDYVTEEKIYKWLKAGYSARQIFLIWNQGHPGPCKSGYNAKGVYYDSCGYADRGEALLTL